MGTRRIALELPGVKDPIRARELVGRTALLEFKLLVDADRARDILTKLDAGIAASIKGQPLPDSLQAATTDTSAKVKADTTALAREGLRQDRYRRH